MAVSLFIRQIYRTQHHDVFEPIPHFHGWCNAHIAGPADFTGQVLQGAIHGIFEIADICVLVVSGKGTIILDDLDTAKGVVHFYKVRQLRPIGDMGPPGSFTLPSIESVYKNYYISFEK